MAVSRLCKNARDEILTGIREKEDNVASKLARGKVAQLWCATETDSLVLNPILAEKFAELLDEYIEALQWCSGNVDFCPNGIARMGWVKICQPLLNL